MDKKIKLTDEEIVKVMKCCAESCLYCDECPLRDDSWCANKVLPMGIDLIHRLQENNASQVRMRCDMQRKFDDLQTLCTEQKAEIERLTRELDDTISMNEMYVEKVRENAELKTQVEKMTEQRNKNYLKGEIIMKDENTLLNEIKEQCGNCEAWSGTDCTRNPYTQGCLKDEKQVIECHGILKGCDMVKQAVKDTAKEILQEIGNIWNGEGEFEFRNSVWFKDLCKRYGVEVE